MKTIDYFYRGPVERPYLTKRGRSAYRRIEGWTSRGPGGGDLYPWLTRHECRLDAEMKGARARFIHGDQPGKGKAP